MLFASYSISLKDVFVGKLQEQMQKKQGEIVDKEWQSCLKVSNEEIVHWKLWDQVVFGYLIESFVNEDSSCMRFDNEWVFEIDNIYLAIKRNNSVC